VSPLPPIDVDKPTCFATIITEGESGLVGVVKPLNAVN